MLQTNADIYYMVASIAIAMLTVFGCIALYYLIRILSRASATLDAIEDMLERAGQITSYFSAVGPVLKMIKNKFAPDDDDDCDDDDEMADKKKKLRTKKRK